MKFYKVTNESRKNIRLEAVLSYRRGVQFGTTDIQYSFGTPDMQYSFGTTDTQYRFGTTETQYSFGTTDMQQCWHY